jgi:AbrB family looped-hinge helix DNA binding protein
MASMMVTIDKVGRIVVPKDVRERLCLDDGAELELLVDGASIRLSPSVTASRTVEMIDGFPRITPALGVRITDADVQGWRDADQR